MKKTTNRFQLQELSYGNVYLKDDYCKNAFFKETLYLKELEPDRLLAGFLETAGKSAKAERYTGWEVTEIQGHTLGHYLSAIAQAYAYSGDHEFKERAVYISGQLKEAQREDGYLFASDEEIFDRVENHKPAWVPWYTMHKIFEGLLLSYELAESKVALEVAEKLGDWVYKRCKSWSPEVHKQVLSVEYGGMNDCLYQLYKITDSDNHLFAAHMFDEIPLFTAMVEKRDILKGLHANTTIPKIVGAMNRYLITGEEFYMEVATSFWEMVINHHTYIIGGNSEWEHFGYPDVLDAERTACNCETCNIYNMLKLTKWLYQVTGNTKYADYYERTWTNAILSSQNPETGMTTYFQPMETGYFKVYSTPYDKFWCCTGTGMENFTKLHESIYFVKDSTLYFSRYISSVLDWSEKGIELSVKANFPQEDKVSIKVSAKGKKTFDIYFRIPDWSAGAPVIKRNGKEVNSQEQQGYLLLTEVMDGDEIEIKFSMEVSCHGLPDNPNAVAFSYGPVVLSAGLGTEKMDITVTGVDVTVPKKELRIKDYLVLKENCKNWISDLKFNLTKKEGEVAFVLHNTDEDEHLIFTPHYKQYQQRYGIYWTLFQEGSEELEQFLQESERKEILNQTSVDVIPIGNDQYELAHMIRGHKTDTDTKDGHRYRYGGTDGWFSYQMNLTDKEQMLCTTYCSSDEGAEFDIYVNEELLSHEVIERKETDFYTKEFTIPQTLISGNSTVNVKFHNKSSKQECRIYDELFIRQL